MSKPNPVEAELIESSGVKPKPKEPRKSFLKRLNKAVNDAYDSDPKHTDWENLSNAAQEWMNKGNEADGEIPDFEADEEPEAEAEEETPNEESETDVAAEAATGKAKTKKAKAGKPVAAKAEKATDKKAAKATNGKTKATNGKAKANGIPREGTISEPWRKTLTALGKAGDKGMDSATLAAAAEKNGAKPFWARFVKSGLMKRVERGTYALTPAGAKAISD